MSPQPASVLPATSIDNSGVVGSSDRNNKKLAKSDFIKLVPGVEEIGFLTSDTRRAFIQLKQAFTKAPIL